MAILQALRTESGTSVQGGKHRILVAGGAGFLGSHLVDHLVAQGHRVIVLDSLTTGSANNLEHLRQNPNFELLQHDVREPLYFSDFDLIYHLACPASPRQYQKDAVKTLQTCYSGTENLLQLASRCKARFLLASTSEIYGEPLVHPQPETYFGNVNPYGPRSCYDEGKRVSESLCWAYKEKYGVDVRIARIFNVYGPRMGASDGRVVSAFIAASIAGEKLRISGDGSATRSFQFVNDCVRGLIELMESHYEKGPVNIGNDMEEISVVRLATTIQQLVADSLPEGRKPGIEFIDRNVNDPLSRKPDISLAREILKWRPSVLLKDGLKETIHWFHTSSSTNTYPNRLVSAISPNQASTLPCSFPTGFRLLEWDSTLFNRRIAQFNPEADDAFETLDAMSAYDIIQTKISTSGTAQSDALCTLGFTLASTEITFSLPIRQAHFAQSSPERCTLATASDLTALKSIARTSFIHSRFRPPWYQREEANLLYATWVTNAVYGTFDKCCFLARRPGTDEVQGFVTVRDVSPTEGYIGLLAVGDTWRRHGVGRLLVNAAQCWAAEKGLRTLKVATELVNLPAVGLYTACGARMCGSAYWFYRIG